MLKSIMMFTVMLALTGYLFAQSYVNVFDFMTPAQKDDVQARTMNYDVTSAIQAAIDSISLFPERGIVYFPAGHYKISSSLILTCEVGLKGESFRASKIAFRNGIGPIISWSPSITSYSLGTHIEDLWLDGLGAASGDSTNHGVFFNHPWGINFPVLRNLVINNCGGYGINAEQTGDDFMHIAFQYALFESIHIKSCANGMRLGEGFCGESHFDNVIIEHCGTGIDFVYGTTSGAGAQGLTFTNLLSSRNNKGIVFSGATTGVIKFINAHFEGNDVYAVEFADPSTRHTVFDSCWFVKNPTALYGTEGGMIEFISCRWDAYYTTDRWIHLINRSNFAININGLQWEGITLNSPIQAVDIAAVKGNMQRTSATTGAFSKGCFTASSFQGRSINSEYATVRGNNLTGKRNIGSGYTSVNVTFSREEPDTFYSIIATVNSGIYTPSWIPAIAIGNKTANGFTAYFSSSPSTGGYALDWMLLR